MKVSELFEASGKWNLPNLSGQMKKFPNTTSPEARSWKTATGLEPMVYQSGEWIIDPKHARKMSEKEMAQPKLQRRTITDEDLLKIYNRAIKAVSDSFPDGDPIDSLTIWFRKNYPNTTDILKTINASMKKFGASSEKKGLYHYLEEMWDEMQADAMFDAKTMLSRGDDVERSVFFNVSNSTITKTQNPWR